VPGPCGWYLSPQGLAAVFKASLDEPSQGPDVGGLIDQVYRGLDTVDRQNSLESLLQKYAVEIHPWFPILEMERMGREARCSVGPLTDPSMALLWLAMLLIIQPPCGHKQHVRSGGLYTAVRFLSAALESQGTADMAMLQTRALLALYECGHGMTQQAHITLSSAIAIANLLDVRHRDPSPVTRFTDRQNDPVLGFDGGDLRWRVALLTLDVVIVLSSFGLLPLVCPTTSALSRHVQAANREIASGHISNPKLRISTRTSCMARVVVLAGRIFERPLEPGSSNSDEISRGKIVDDMSWLVENMIAMEGSHSLSLCDPIAMALW
jgi:hypothetical protein